MILGPQGEPQPPSEVLERLKEIDESLGLRYVAGLLGENWALTWRWPENDRRRERIRKGEIPANSDCDVFCYIPVDCPVSEAYHFAARSLRRVAVDRDWERTLSRLDAHNEGVRQKALDEIRELGHELFTTNAGTLFQEQGKKVPKVFMNEWRAKKLKRPKPIDYNDLPEELK